MAHSLIGKKIVITAGPTREYLDPVRFLTNPSSGKMGLVLAETLRRRGARVILVCGPVAHPFPAGVQVIRVVSAVQMAQAVKKALPGADAFIATAAVCDFRFARPHSKKMKKGSAQFQRVVLTRNPDILAEAGLARKKKKAVKPVLIGFSLETENVDKNAAAKLHQKNLDLIVGNTPQSFGSPFIRPLWMEKSSAPKLWPRMTKSSLSTRMAHWLAERLHDAK